MVRSSTVDWDDTASRLKAAAPSEDLKQRPAAQHELKSPHASSPSPASLLELRRADAALLPAAATAAVTAAAAARSSSSRGGKPAVLLRSVSNIATGGCPSRPPFSAHVLAYRAATKVTAVVPTTAGSGGPAKLAVNILPTRPPLAGCPRPRSPPPHSH